MNRSIGRVKPRRPSSFVSAKIHGTGGVTIHPNMRNISPSPQHKIVAYYPIHYGAEYLEASIKSIEDAVSLIFILYTSKPTYGHNTTAVCPETEEQLRNIATKASTKVKWVNVTSKHFCNESAHRSYAEVLATEVGASEMLAVDADEVHDTNVLRSALEEASKLQYRYVNVSNWYNFYRSFDWVCRDQFTPTRIINLKCNNTKGHGLVQGLIWHFGYCLPDAIMNYKWAIHGHKNELRPNWMREKYFNWKLGVNDVHPVVIGLWNPQKFDKSTLPQVLKNHPNFHKDIVN